jgi:segregation and condensation protein A
MAITSNSANQTYTIKLAQFEGPFDLLLFFIERDELDIYNIPISKVTEDFLAYIREMESMNVDLASEFILVAATLMRIKARMLLPRKPVDEEGNEIDPRQELVDRLLEYKRYKSVLDEMRVLEETRGLRNERGNIHRELKVLAEKALVDAEMESVNLFRLLKTFERLISRFDKEDKKPVHQVFQYNFTVQQQTEFIFSRIRITGRTDFEDLFSECVDRVHAIVTFLALLEMANLQLIAITNGGQSNQFWVAEKEFSEEENQNNLEIQE